jgi:hypothetical protein
VLVIEHNDGPKTHAAHVHKMTKTAQNNGAGVQRHHSFVASSSWIS